MNCNFSFAVLLAFCGGYILSPFVVYGIMEVWEWIQTL